MSSVPSGCRACLRLGAACLGAWPFSAAVLGTGRPRPRPGSCSCCLGPALRDSALPGWGEAREREAGMFLSWEQLGCPLPAPRRHMAMAETLSMVTTGTGVLVGRVQERC